MKKELKFESSLKDLDKIFFIRDLILKEGYVSEKLSRVICRRISNTYNSWNTYLHSILVPNPSSLLNISESQIFDEKEKEEISQLMDQIMALVSRNNLIGITKDKKQEAKFIDDSAKFWNQTCNPELIRLMKKINNYWVERAKSTK